ncbi:hypothetical protein [Chitinibacter tainanensis]|uniref:hypothetical protein n=1 Tax=Chitinibacter tainanensis TaxID=230667 RepID=UPI0003F9722C|nr:hypothetical protein [Chitinibacter tainanensis]
MNPEFRQTLPKPADDLVLLTPDTRLYPHLRYHDPATGEYYLVPNIWYNRPLAIQLEIVELDYQRIGARIAAYRKAGKPYMAEAMEGTQRAVLKYIEELKAQIAARAEAKGEALGQEKAPDLSHRS